MRYLSLGGIGNQLFRKKTIIPGAALLGILKTHPSPS